MRHTRKPLRSRTTATHTTMTNMTVPPVTEQYDYISELGAAYNHALDTDSSDKKFVLNTQNNPKPEFTRLVVHHYGCVGGDSFWNSHWTQCFGEKYPYGRESNHPCFDGRVVG